MPAHLIDISIRSTVLALIAYAVEFACRRASAAFRHALWTALVCGMLALFAFGNLLPRLPLRILGSETAPVVRDNSVALSAAAPIVDDVPLPIALTAQPAAPVAPAKRSRDWSAVALFFYAAIATALLLRYITGMVLALRLLARGNSVRNFRETTALSVPVTIGWFRPRILLPAEWRQWDGETLAMVLAHEGSHVRRRDGLTGALAAINRCLFWFHPLAWVLESKLAALAEQACDDFTVATLGDRNRYAQLLVEMAAARDRSQGRLRRHALTMAASSHLGQRIDSLLQEGRTFPKGLSRTTWVSLALCGVPLVFAAGTLDPGRRPPQLRRALPALLPQAAQDPRRPGPAPAFDIADVHSITPNFIRGMRQAFAHGRYELRNATMLELIATANGVDTGSVVGGPAWLDVDQFDIVAAAPPDSAPEILRVMLQRLIQERFGLVTHGGTKDIRAYVLTAGGKPRLKEAGATAAPGCQLAAGGDKPLIQGPGGAIAPSRNGELTEFECRGLTMAAFAAQLPRLPGAAGYFFNNPVIDQTGLAGAWDFNVKWSLHLPGFAVTAPGVQISLFDAVEKQLGLKLELTTTPSAVVVVDHVDRAPTPNPPGATERLPPPKLEFDVADVKPEDPRDGMEGSHVAIRPGGLVDIRMTLRGLIVEAWNMDPDRVVGGPSSLDSARYQITAKAPATQFSNGPAVWNGIDIDSMRAMLRALLRDRFKLVIHDEDRSVPGYALAAGKPKLVKADPANRPGCHEGAGADGKDPRAANPLASRLVTCQNMTMAQFAAALRNFASDYLEPHPPLVNATGIEGAYDMTLNFSPRRAAQAVASGNAGEAEFNGTISLSEALERQLGLKLESRNVIAPVIVIDRMEETPADN